jgi:hypothetical protein
MSAVLHPVGPQPQRVYWVRRLLLLLVVVVVAAVAWSVAQGARGGAAEASEEATGETTEDAADPAAEGDAAVVEPGPVEGDAGPAACTPVDLALTLTTATRSFGPEEQPVFTAGITNTGAAACTVDAGDAAREIVITSGTDRIWSSLDCPVESPARLLLLEAGARDEVEVTWPRVRSAAGCPADLPAPRAGTYSAVMTVIATTSAAAVFDLG